MDIPTHSRARALRLRRFLRKVFDGLGMRWHRVPVASETATETKDEDMSTESIKRYSISELHAIASQDRHAVRDEVVRRHNKAARQLSKAQKLVSELEALAKLVM